MIRYLKDPVYISRPSQILKRIQYMLAGTSPREEAKLSWGGRLLVLGKEKNGRTILHRGVKELVVTEALFRLAQPGTIAVDGGANVGHMTSALAHSMGKGEIYSFEPHPSVFSILRKNQSRIEEEVSGVQIDVRPAALSSNSGTAQLHVPDLWKYNSGTASLEDLGGSTTFETDTYCLDDEINDSIQLLKLDVEGHEINVLNGAQNHLSRRSINHIVFEDHEGLNSAVCKKLRQAGYSIFGIEKHLRGPILTKRERRDAYNFIATLYPDECTSAFEPNGWNCLRTS